VYIRSTVGKSSVTSNVNDRGQEYDRVKWSWNEGDISMSESKTQSQEMDHSYLTRVFHKLCPFLKSISPQVDMGL
jgi:ABC-type phosphate transport system ATPase subunit